MISLKDASEFEIAQVNNTERARASGIILNIKKRNWMPQIIELEEFYKDTYKQIVNTYKNLAQTQQYTQTTEFLLARYNDQSVLGYTQGGGFTTFEASATHTFGWELQSMYNQYKKRPEPFTLHAIILGHKGNGTDDGISADGQPRSIFERAA